MRVPLLLMVIILGLMIEAPASAYTDPGSGILLWQIVASGFLTVLFYLRKLVGFNSARRNRVD